MRFHQVRDIVAWACDFHARLAHRYSYQAKRCEHERTRMALSYLAQREHEMQAGLARYLTSDSEHRHVLDTSYNDLTELPHPQALADLSVANCKSLGSVLANALEIHEMLEDMFTRRSEDAAIDAEKALFAALASGQEAEVRRLVRNMARLETY
jgi:hypothetical protein